MTSASKGSSKRALELLAQLIAQSIKEGVAPLRTPAPTRRSRLRLSVVGG